MPPSARSSAAIRSKRQLLWNKIHPILLDKNANLTDVINIYIANGAGFADHILHEIRYKIDIIAAQDGLFDKGRSIFDKFGRITPYFLQEIIPQYIDAYYDPAPQGSILSHEVFPESRNEYYDVSKSVPVTAFRRSKIRPGLRIYSAQECELFVSSDAYQVIDRQKNLFFPSASPKSISKPALFAQTTDINKNIIVIQDRFWGDNFSHFLFDWIPRIGHFINSKMESIADCVFVAGGIPGPFQFLLLEAVYKIYGIDSAQIFFPDDEIILRTARRIYWFSDQVEAPAHPAHVAHPRSIDIIKGISHALEISPAPFKNLYLSRADAGRRRVHNEDQVWHELHKLEFETVWLSDLPIREQISLIRGADVIVAPHGMGLTLASLHTGNPKIVELFHPQRGTDAYAVMATALGHNYSCVVGEPSDSEFDDYDVSLSKLSKIVSNVMPEQSSGKRGQVLQTNLISGSSEFTGNWVGEIKDQPAQISADVPQLIPGTLVVRHQRMGGRISNTNCGCWHSVRIEPLKIYTASCWVWIPEDFDGRQVAVTIGEWGQQRGKVADIRKRNQWQRIWASATTPANTSLCAMVIRIDSDQNSVVYSTCWQINEGPSAQDYHKN